MVWEACDRGVPRNIFDKSAAELDPVNMSSAQAENVAPCFVDTEATILIPTSEIGVIGLSVFLQHVRSILNLIVDTIIFKAKALILYQDS